MLKIVKNAEEFKQNAKEGKVVIDFFASWCGPCKMLAPVLEQFAEENPQITVLKVDVDVVPEVAESFEVVSVPTLYLVENGVVTNKTVGFMSKVQLEKFVG